MDIVKSLQDKVSNMSALYRDAKVELTQAKAEIERLTIERDMLRNANDDLAETVERLRAAVKTLRSWLAWFKREVDDACREQEVSPYGDCPQAKVSDECTLAQLVAENERLHEERLRAEVDEGG